MRINLSEITPQRIRDALVRRFLDVPDLVAWRADCGASAENRARLKGLRSRHAGEPCVILANGPSLANVDLARLEGAITIGMNRAYVLYEPYGFSPTYYVCVNELVLDQFADDIKALKARKLLNWNRRALFRSNEEDTLFLRPGLAIRDFFEGDLTKTICSGGTVTYVALQVAYFLGIKEVILLGLDHQFVEKGTPNRTEIRTAAVDESHCHPNYFPRGTRWQLPDLSRSERAYALARSAFERDGRSIIDATEGGKCDVFNKGKLSQLLTGPP